MFDQSNARLGIEQPNQQAAQIALAKLLRNELLAIAKDIVTKGLDPIAPMAVTPEGAPAGLTFSPGNSMIASFVFDYSAPRVFDHLFLTMELQYLKTTYSAHFQVYPAVYDLTIDTKLFRIPIGLKYNFLTEKSTPYIKLGYTFSISEKADAKLIQQTITTTEYNEEGMFSMQPNGWWFALGYNQLVSKKAKVFLELRYEQTNSFLFVMDLGFSNMKNFTVSTGIRF